MFNFLISHTVHTTYMCNCPKGQFVICYFHDFYRYFFSLLLVFFVAVTVLFIIPSLCVLCAAKLMLNHSYLFTLSLLIQWDNINPEAELFGKIVRVNIQCKRKQTGDTKLREWCIVFKVKGFARINQCRKYIL